MAQLPIGGQIINNPVFGGPAGGQLINNLQAGGANLQSQPVFYELPGYTEQYDQHGNESRRILMTPWSIVDSDVFPTAVLGDVTVAGNGFFNRSLPFQHPKKKKQYADELHLRGEGKGAFIQATGGLISYKDVINNMDGMGVWEVIYRTPPYMVLSNQAVQALGAAPKPVGAGQLFGAPPPKPAPPQLYEFNRWVTRREKPAEESLLIPKNSFLFLSDGKPFSADISILGPLWEFRYTWHWVPVSTYYNLIFNVLPKVIGLSNDADFDAIPVGQGLCMTPEVSGPIWTPSGNEVRDITFILLARKNTWNQFWRSDIGGYDTLVGRGGQLVGGVAMPAPGPYGTADFTQLFKAA